MKVYAKVNGKEITQRDLDFMLATLPPERAGQFATEEGMQYLVEEVINNQLLYEDALNEKLDQTEEFMLEVERLKSYVLKNLYLRNLLDDVEPSDEDLKKFYNENERFYITQPQVRASHILVSEEALANEILEKINSGESFEAMAKEYSMCPSKEVGGDLGTFGRGMMVPEFEQEAFRLEENMIGDITKTQFGYHIIKNTGIVSGGSENFDDIKHKVVNDFINMKQSEIYFNKIKSLKENSNIEIL
jgi:peptidyl-prolyl cis-trans isomerase C